MSSRNYTHISIGNFNLDIALYINSIPPPGSSTLVKDFDIRPGGAATNYAVAVARYGHSAYLVASTSNYPIVKSALQSLKELGVDTTYVKEVNQPPGSVVILILPEGERTMLKYPGSNEFIQSSDVPEHLMARAHVIHMASVKPDLVSGIARIARRKGVVITYDPGVYAESLGGKAGDILRDVDILFTNESEFKLLTREIRAENFFKFGLSILVVKMGSRGAFVRLPSGICYHGSAHPIRKPVDSTGAGDAFDAFFNSKYLESKDPGVALMYAVAAGALKIGCRGSFLCWDPRLFEAQLEKAIVEQGVDKCP
ncbi:MAG: PfkB family carbohydrate kinase [Desulfurococcaceae archaeon]